MMLLILFCGFLGARGQSEWDPPACFNRPPAKPSTGELGIIPNDDLGTTFIHFKKSWDKSEAEFTKNTESVPPNHRACLLYCQLLPDCRYVIINSKASSKDKPCSISTASMKKWRGERFRKGQVGGSDYELEYYEKVCKTDAMKARMAERNCEKRLFGGAQQGVMLGRVKHVATAPSSTLGECLALCLDIPDCASAMFYYEDSECLMNVHHAFDSEVKDAMTRGSPEDDSLDGLMDFVEVKCEKIGTSSNGAAPTKRRFIKRAT